MLIEQYPYLDEAQIVKAQTWTSLNNSDETLVLRDKYFTVFDSLAYSYSSFVTDYSLERESPLTNNWAISISPKYSTPGYQNSILPLEYDIKIDLVEMLLEEDKIHHKITVKNEGIYDIETFLITIISQTSHFSEEELFASNFSLSDSLLLDIFTDVPFDGLTQFKYLVENLDDMNPDNNNNILFYNSENLPVVINEIMYNPLVDEPEWIEIKFNTDNPDFRNIFIESDDKQIELHRNNGDYIVLTGSEEDSLFLRNLITENIPIFCGLGALTNSGETLTIGFQNQLVESITYLPEYSEVKGVSIERIQSSEYGFENNWGPCSSASGSTIGGENSIFIEHISSQTKVTINPNPFSPNKSENVLIKYILPEKLHKISCRIFDLKGRLIRDLVNQDVMGAEGVLIWNGKNNEGRLMQTGIYIMLLEAISRDSNKTYKDTDTIVIGF